MTSTELQQEDKATATQTDLRRAAKSYLSTYDGPVTKRTVVFGSRAIKQIYRRDQHILPRNALFTTYFARLQFGDDIVDPLENALFKKVENIDKKFENQIGQYKVLLQQSGLTEDDLAASNLPESFEAVITSPLYGKMLRLMEKADKVHNYVDTLWMNGIVTTRQFSELRLAIRRDIRSLSAFLRNTWISLQKRVQADKLAEIKAAVGGEDEVASAPKKQRRTKAAPADSAQPAATQGDLITDAAESQPASQVEPAIA